MFATASLNLLFERFSMAPKSRAPSKPDPLKEILHASGALANDPEAEADMKTTTGLSRMVDMRIPLWGLLTVLGTGVMLLVILWFNVQQLMISMADVQLTLKAGNSQATANAIEIATIRLRLENAERTYRDLQQQMTTQQQYQQRGTR